MQIDSSFSLIDAVISTMRGHSKHIPDIISNVSNEKTNIPDILDAENNMGVEVGILRHGSLINLDNLPVRITNLNIAAHAYETNIGLLSRYLKMTETKLEIVG